MQRRRRVDTYNVGYAQQLYEQFVQNPALVDESWHRLFEAGFAAEAGLITEAPAAAAPPSLAQLRAAMAAGKLVMAYRLNGHWAARLDPLGSPPAGHPTLDPEFHGVTQAELETVPASTLGLGDRGATMADALRWIRSIYTGSIGYEYEHLEDPERRNWLRDTIEAGEHRRPLSDGEQVRLLERLSEVEALEHFLHRAYLGSKRFSIEGTDMLVPMLDLGIERAAGGGAREVVLGMAHRGRLNVLAHVLGKPYMAIVAEFEGQHASFGTSGDVKYHLGAEGTYATASGEPLTVTLVPNPSHLEYVNPVVEGIVRAKQTDRLEPAMPREEEVVLPILMHGDAAFSGQGVVTETLNLAHLDGYRTGGTLHIVVNNQIGFTTEPSEGRSMRYASDVALGFDIPIFHVNADDADACLAVVRLAMAYQQRFRTDVLIDLVGYRRYGHNEGDEPAYTQPVMYRTIHDHPPVRQLWAETLVAQGVISESEVEAIREAAYGRLVEAQEQVKAAADGRGPDGIEPEPEAERGMTPVDTTVDAGRLRTLDRELHAWPEGFSVNPKLARQLERRGRVLAEDGPIDWAHAESLALASLLADGTPVRMTGQDTVRGTFSQRHLVLHDVETGRTYCPLADLDPARAGFEVHNSPLSELGVLGFEYGYSIAAPDALVLWEAQFGDFANAAQVIIDQFIAAGRAKWGQASRLVLLLPHGYEGRGPEHSSARPERFLQLAAENNIRVANCTTPAQYFHLLRSQAIAPERRPMAIMTPKSLLRHPRATSRLDELAGGRFHAVLPDAAADDVTRVLLCSGKVYYDLAGSDRRAAAAHVGIVRIEELYPFPRDELAAALEAFPGMRELVWVQEEPRNMGAWQYIQPRLLDMVGDAVPLAYVGRPERASPAEGFANVHEREQSRIVEEALAEPVARPRLASSGQRRRGG